MKELVKPGCDPRKKFEIFSFTKGIVKIEDVRHGLQLPGIVMNVTAFGGFVDIGVHHVGLVHIVSCPTGLLKTRVMWSGFIRVHQRVIVTVLDVDLGRKRISLSLRKQPVTNA